MSMFGAMTKLRKENEKNKENIDKVKALQRSVILQSQCEMYEGSSAERIRQDIYDNGYINALEYVIALFENREPETFELRQKVETGRTVASGMRVRKEE